MALAALAVVAGATLAQAQASDFAEPWKNPDRALVVDAYEYNPIDWSELAKDKRVVGFIAKSSDGLPPSYRCAGDEIEHGVGHFGWGEDFVVGEVGDAAEDVGVVVAQCEGCLDHAAISSTVKGE